jgi:hypothetical protein
MLLKYKIELFEVEEYKWKYLIKSTHPKYPIIDSE